VSSKTFPSLKTERELLSGGARYIIGIDEVGRGALAGPVAVGAALIDSHSPEFLDGTWPSALADSKLMTAKSRDSTAPQVAGWVAAWQVGFASAAEIDEFGIIQGLVMSATRALELLMSNFHDTNSLVTDGTVILLDGSHNWLAGHTGAFVVHHQPKADRDCVSVAAAALMAKVSRDALMVQLAAQHPRYGFEGHKGYGAASHLVAIREYGPSPEHRVSWLTRILPDASELEF
jgi:ribonuclease HII